VKASLSTKTTYHSNQRVNWDSRKMMYNFIPSFPKGFPSLTIESSLKKRIQRGQEEGEVQGNSGLSRYSFFDNSGKVNYRMTNMNLYSSLSEDVVEKAEKVSSSLLQDDTPVTTDKFDDDHDPSKSVGTEDSDVSDVNTFVRCSRCSAAYSVSEAMLGPEGSRVKCEVCGHSWYQATNRLQLLAEGFALKPYPEEMMEKVKDNVSNNRHPMDNYGNGKRAEISIFVGNLPFSITEEKLENLFVNYGELSNVTIVKDAQNKSRGYGFIEMVNKEAGEKAIQDLDQTMIDGRNINVKLGGGKYGNGNNNGNRRR
jgi:predicted Zn finger-like uncharacterized protein